MNNLGVLLAGGSGSRLLPLTKITNKHLLPVGNVPMIYHPIDTLKSAGIRDIVIVTGVDHMGDIVQLLGSGKDFDCNFTYKVQDEAGGIAQALGLVENICNNRRMLVILGDNIFGNGIKIHEGSSARIFLKEVDNPQRYGVAEINKDGELTKIVEKPKIPPSNLAVTGLYEYGPSVFEIIKQLKPSGRGELEITDVNNAYIKAGRMEASVLDKYWTDAGTFESLAEANQLKTKL